MSAVDFGLGAASLAVLVAAGAVTGLMARRRWLSDWAGAPARLAEAVVAVATITVLAQLLGVVGLFDRWPLVMASVAVATAMTLSSRPRDGERADRARGPRSRHRRGRLRPAH